MTDSALHVPPWKLLGTSSQNTLVQQAIRRCAFDFTKLTPSLTREGKTAIRVEWADLSRYAATGHAESAHTIVREVDGRQRVLGLFYLPPYTRVVLDVTLEQTPVVAQEVFLAEGAHAVDYHYMTSEHRRRFVNSVHTQQLPSGADTSDGATFNLDGHTCGWFDVNSYAMWVGEAFMEGFIEATADVPVTINLGHPVGPEDRTVIRQLLGIDPPPPGDLRLSVVCPRCGAAVGQRCRTRSGRVTSPHAARVAAASTYGSATYGTARLT